MKNDYEIKMERSINGNRFVLYVNEFFWDAHETREAAEAEVERMVTEDLEATREQD